jgi:hypothetical protein
MEDLTKLRGYIRTATPEEITAGHLTSSPDAPGLVFGKETIKNLTITKQPEQELGELPIGYKDNRSPIEKEFYAKLQSNMMSYLPKETLREKIRRKMADIEQPGMPTSGSLNEKATKWFNTLIGGKGHRLPYGLNKGDTTYDWTLDFPRTATKTIMEYAPESFNMKGYELTNWLNKQGLAVPVLVKIEEHTSGAFPFAVIGGAGSIGSKVGRKNLAPAVPYGLFGTQATTRLIEPEFKIKLSKKKASRSSGLDLVEVDKNTYFFTELITIPRRMITVSTPVNEYFGNRNTKLYSRQVNLRHESITPIKVNNEGDIMPGAYTKLEVLNPLPRYRRVEIKPQSFLMDISTRPRLEPKIIKYNFPTRYYDVSNLKGGARIAEFDKLRKNLDKEQNLQLDSLFKSANQRTKFGADILKSNQDIFIGGIFSDKVYRMGFNPKTRAWTLPRITPKGKRRTRADIFGIQEKLIETPEKDLFSYLFNARDITFPISRRVYSNTKGYSLVSKETSNQLAGYSQFQGTKTTKRTIAPVDEMLSAQLSNIGLTSAKNIKPQKLPKPKTNTQDTSPIKSVSPFEGSGMYEQTEGYGNIDLFRDRNLERSKSNQKSFSLNKNAIQPKNIEVVRNINQLRNVPRELQIPKEIQRQPQRIINIPRETLRQRLVIRQIEIPRIQLPPRKPNFTPPPEPHTKQHPTNPRPPRFDYNKHKNKTSPSQLSAGFQTLLKRFGKWQTLPGIRPKGQAIKYGEQKAIDTLARSFKIKPTPVKVLSNRMPKSYTPSNFFRDYRIKNRQKEVLSNTWIQRAINSLSSSGEKREIRAARQNRKGRWLI